MLTLSDMQEIVAQIDADGYEFVVLWDYMSQCAFLQVQFEAADLVTGDIETQHGRKWTLSKHMTKSEIVSTAFKALLTAVEHETRESFRYKGRSIFGPHFDVDGLVEFASSRDNLDMRTGAWVKEFTKSTTGGTA